MGQRPIGFTRHSSSMVDGLLLADRIAHERQVQAKNTLVSSPLVKTHVFTHHLMCATPGPSLPHQPSYTSRVSCNRTGADLLPKHCAKKVSFPWAGSNPFRAAEYCCSASAHCRLLNAALPASLALVMARSLFRPRAHAAESGSLRSACMPASKLLGTATSVRILLHCLGPLPALDSCNACLLTIGHALS